MTGSVRRLVGAACVGGVLLLGACSSDREPGPPAAERPAATTQAGAGPDAGPDAAAGPGDVHADLPEPLPHPVDDAASRLAALYAATTAVTAFARPELPAETWWSELTPLLTPAATVAYEGTDPREVPPSSVTGPARLGASTSAYLATVLVPTDAGEYAVLLAREGGGAPWLVERITPVVPTGPVAPSSPAPDAAAPAAAPADADPAAAAGGAGPTPAPAAPPPDPEP